MPRKTKNIKYYEGVGRRKEAVAQVRLYICGKNKEITLDGLKIRQGEIYVNKKPIEKVFSSLSEKTRCLAPLRLTNNENRFAISILVKGGGRKGWLGAIINGLAYAIEKSDKDTYRPVLKKLGFLRRDSRVKERRKVGTGRKARRKKQSPKR